MHRQRSTPCSSCLLALVLLLCSDLAWAQRAIELISYTNVYTQIVVADKPSGPAVAAAGILQQTLYRITGQRMDIRSESEYLNDPDRRRVAILVGNSKMAKDEMGVEVEQNQDTGDHYIIKADGPKQRIVLAGNDESSSYPRSKGFSTSPSTLSRQVEASASGTLEK